MYIIIITFYDKLTAVARPRVMIRPLRETSIPTGSMSPVQCSQSNYDELSDLSDGDGYLYPIDDETKIHFHNMRPAPCRLSSVRDLFEESDKVGIL